MRSPRKRTSPELTAPRRPESERRVVVLPAPLPADEGDDLPLADLEGDPLERVDLAVVEVEILHFEKIRHPGYPPSRPR